MASISIPSSIKSTAQVRPFNLLRDITATADLIELSFSPGLDDEGQRYIQQMRRAGKDKRFLQWAIRAANTVSMPLTGYVWEENGEIVGNASLIPFSNHKELIYLIANVAVHPDYRRQGIGRELTACCLQHARQRKAHSIWLHVKEENQPAINLYNQLGFEEQARRTIWQADNYKRCELAPLAGVKITSRKGWYWTQQQSWLAKNYPHSIAWYQSTDWKIFGTGWQHWLHLLFSEMDLRQWAVLRDDQLQGVLSQASSFNPVNWLWLAAPDTPDEEAIKYLLRSALNGMSKRSAIRLEYPCGLSEHIFHEVGFTKMRSQIWMKTEGATA